ncbi:MAG: TrbG/VirB9 family P-type conjugative transfer protein [Acetobacteraceae bacterium]|nr:TrbG/VirB9 family P-type conjugative transfer protein [Acetobacteraceae bacterium]
MKFKTAIILANALTFAGCATQQPPAPAMVPAAFTPAPPVRVPPDPLDSLPTGLRQAYISGSDRPVRDGFAVYLPYREYRAPIVHASPDHVTEIVLDPSEHITHAWTGDNLRWAIWPEGNHLRLKACPKGCNSINGSAAQVATVEVPTVYSTNLVVDTDHPRTYHFELVAGPLSRATETLVMWYPEDIATAESNRRDAMRKAAAQAIDPPDLLDCSYTISGPNVPWKPTQACSDSTHEYLLFTGSAPYEGDMPSLYVQQDNRQQLVNFHSRSGPQGTYYVTDRLYSQAALTQGVGNNKQIVTITAAGH